MASIDFHRDDKMLAARVKFHISTIPRTTRQIAELACLNIARTSSGLRYLLRYGIISEGFVVNKYYKRISVYSLPDRRASLKD